MSLSYLCPKCHAVLNPNVRVVLVARFENRKGIVLMSPKLGDYKFHCDKGFYEGVRKGDVLEFLCPVCTESLTSPTMHNFAELVVVNGNGLELDGDPHLLRFSRVSEEHATFLHDGQSIREYGEDAEVVHKRLSIEGEWSW